RGSARGQTGKGPLMRNKLLLSTAALLAGVAIASAQDMPGGKSGGAAQSGAQSERGAAGASQDQGHAGKAQGGAQEHSKQGQSQQRCQIGRASCRERGKSS